MMVSIANDQNAVETDLKHVVHNYLEMSSVRESQSFQNRMPILFLSYLLLLCIPLLLYTVRFLDDNSLVSWYWAFSQQYFSQTRFFAWFAVLSLLLAMMVVAVNVKWMPRINIVFLSVFSFVITIPFWQIPEIIIDNARYFTQAKYVELYGVGYFVREWGQGIFTWTDLPLLPLIYGLAFKLFGEHRAVIQLCNSLFFTASVAATYFLGKTLWGHAQGITAATLLMGIPYIYTQIPLMMVDVPSMFFILLAVLTTVRAIQNGGNGYIAIAASVIVLALFTKYSAWLFFTVLPLTVFATPSLAWRTRISRLRKVGFGAAVLMLLALYWYYPVMIEQWNILMTYQWGALDRWQESHVSTFLFHVHPMISVAALVSLFFAIKNRDKKYLILSWMLVLVLLLDIQRIRYLMVVFPMLTLMAGYAFAQIPDIPLKKLAVGGVFVTSYGIALSMSGGFLPHFSASNLQSAGAYLDNLEAEVIDVLVLPQQRSEVNPKIAVAALDYHTNKNLRYIGGGLASDTKTENQLEISKSPVRFTWEYPMPRFYTNAQETDDTQKTLAVIYSDIHQLTSQQLQAMLKDYQLLKRFQAQAGMFRYKTFIDLYISG